MNMQHATTSEPKKQQNVIRLNKNFLNSVMGVLNVALMVLLLGGIIAIAVVPKAGYSMHRTSTESAYLVFACIGLALEILLFIIEILGLTSFTVLNRIPFWIIYAVKDLIFGIALFGIGISCAVRENSINYYKNSGAFSAAAVFAFLSTLVYMMHFILCIMKLLASKNEADITG